MWSMATILQELDGSAVTKDTAHAVSFRFIRYLMLHQLASLRHHPRGLSSAYLG